MTFPGPLYSPLGPVVIVETANDNSAANNPSYTFSAKAIGAAEPDRYVAVAVTMEDDGVSAAATAVTIGGISATQAVGVSFAALSESIYSGVWIAKVPTGTTADIVVTGNTTMTGCAITVYRVTGINSATATDTDTDSGSKTTFTMDLDVRSGGGAIGAVKHRDQTGAFTWTGLTEDDDFQSDNTRHGAASEEFTSTQTARAIQVVSAGSAQAGCSACAHWA